jgi:hypothetical protein
MRKTTKDKRIFFATRDYFNDKGGRTDAIALHLTGRKPLKNLSESEKSDIWAIKENMTDSQYMASM